MTYTLLKKYQDMNEAEVQAALADKNDNQIIHELACLMDDYTRQVKKLLQDGKNPHSLLTIKTCALEGMALRMVLDVTKLSTVQKG
ncbi:MAG: hypothetical protein Q8K65_03480 [Alphaproteobacteria bacterium]|nr:hypothetical protein [Alphaproteobacteria bacterium]